MSTAMVAAIALTIVTPLTASAAASQGVEGFWRTDGYGLILAIDRTSLRTYETTSISCLSGLLSAERGASGPDGSVAFTDNGHPLLTFEPQGRGHAVLQVAGKAAGVNLTRLSALPGRCTAPMPTDPVTSFDVFWQTFAENYPFFAAKGVDWQGIRATYRPQIHTADELSTKLREILGVLRDAHTQLTDSKGTIGGPVGHSAVRPDSQGSDQGPDRAPRCRQAFAAMGEQADRVRESSWWAWISSGDRVLWLCRPELLPG
ncbi:hypothetical protein [Actinocrispum wychmicini]|nr:hypothetical protein [Actinocrispum wychmicini]